MSEQSMMCYEKPQVLSSSVNEGQYLIGPGAVVVLIVAISLLALIGAFGICVAAGYTGVAFTVSLDNWSVKIGCYV